MLRKYRFDHHRFFEVAMITFIALEGPSHSANQRPKAGWECQILGRAMTFIKVRFTLYG